MLQVLLKKQITEKLSKIKQGKNIDYLGIIISLTVSVFAILVVVFVFSEFIEKYIQIRIKNILDTKARQFEIMSIVYEAVLLVSIFSSVTKLNAAIFENDDRNILLTLPIKPSTVFLSKLLTVLGQQAVFSMVTLLPLNLIFSVVTGQGAGYILLSIFIAFLFPVLTLAIASVFCLPVYFIKKFLELRFFLLFIIITVLFGVGLWGYTKILGFISTLMTTGDIKFFFSENVMNIIASLSKKVFPANLMANLILGNNTIKNALYLLLITGVAGAVGYFLINKLYNLALGQKTQNSGSSIYIKKGIGKKSSVFVALFKKEFISIFHTPNYAIQYFSVAAIMPLMVYFCIKIGQKLLISLVFVQRDLELTLFLIIIFTALTNTFCATNISREGKAFYTLKTMPLTCKQIIGFKVLFNVFIQIITLVISVTIVSSTGYITAFEGFFVFIVGLLIGFSQICIATRKDLNRPHFPIDSSNEIKETNSNVSIIIVFGLLNGIILGGIPLAVSILNSLKGIGGKAFTYYFALGYSVFITAVAVLYFLVNMKKSFAQLTEGGL